MSRSRKKNISNLETNKQNSCISRSHVGWKKYESKKTHNRKFVSQYLRSNMNEDFENDEENLKEIKYKNYCVNRSRKYSKRDIISEVKRNTNELKCINYIYDRRMSEEKIEIYENSFEIVPFKQQCKKIILNFVFINKLFSSYCLSYYNDHYLMREAEKSYGYLFSRAIGSFFPVKPIYKNNTMFEQFYDANKLTKFLKRK